MEREVQVRCREQDYDLVGGLLESASKEFSQLIKKETDVEFTTKATIDKNNPLNTNDCE